MRIYHICLEYENLMILTNKPGKILTRIIIMNQWSLIHCGCHPFQIFRNSKCFGWLKTFYTFMPPRPALAGTLLAEKWKMKWKICISLISAFSRSVWATRSLIDPIIALNNATLFCGKFRIDRNLVCSRGNGIVLIQWSSSLQYNVTQWKC